MRLHADGLLFRDVRMVHWCAHLRTVISDIEVDHVDVTQRTKHRLPNGRTVDIGVIHRIRYTVVDANGAPRGELEVDTTRPETMLADQAVAIHPHDERYAVFRGMRVLHPLTDAPLPLVCDPVLVDMALGTGAVKVTPAHDANDFECAKRHGLSTAASMLNDDGTVSGDDFVPHAYRGMHRFECREAVIKALTASGRYAGARNHTMRVAVCSRSGDIVEPRLKPQWFVRCDALNERARGAVATGALTLLPAARAVDWDRWLSTDASRVWCVSRQLWWGHRIPAWRVVATGSANASSSSASIASASASAAGAAPSLSAASASDSEDRWFVAHTETEARALASAALGVAADRLTLAQDDDVLDTWFSSALFPLSTFGWPAATDASSSSSSSSSSPASSSASASASASSSDSAALASAPSPPGYPLSTMITGRDIMFFWVARMVLLCAHLSPHRQLPFPQAVLHPLIRGSGARARGNQQSQFNYSHGTLCTFF